MSFCIPPELIDEVKALVSSPTSAERINNLSGRFGVDVAQQINLSYERALTSSAYAKALEAGKSNSALSKFFRELQVTPEKRLEIKQKLEANIARKEGIIDDKELTSIVKDMIDSKYKLKISDKESLTLLRLNKEVKAASDGPLDKMGENPKLGEALFNQEEYLINLEHPTNTMKFKEEFSHNWNETKQGWKDLEGAGFWSKTGYVGGKAAKVIFSNAYKSLKATLDASFTTIQGNTIAISSPKVFVSSIKEAIRGFKNPEDTMRAFRIKQMSDPNYFNMIEDGLRLPSREEQFMSSMVEKVGVGVGSTIKRTNNAFTMFLQHARMQEYKRVLAVQEQNLGRKLDRTDANFEMLEKADKFAIRDSQRLKEIASHANKITGTTNLGSAEKQAEILNSVLFAGRYTLSGIRMITDVIRPQSWESRVLASKTLAMNTGALYGSYWALSALYPDATDMRPNSANFMKVKNDLGTFSYPKGVDQWIVQLIAKLVTGESISAKGKTYKYGTGYGEGSKLEEVSRTIRGKLAPQLSVASDFLAGKDMGGHKATIGREAVNLAAPIFPTSVIDNLLSDKTLMEQVSQDFWEFLGGGAK